MAEATYWAAPGGVLMTSRLAEASAETSTSAQIRASRCSRSVRSEATSRPGGAYTRTPADERTRTAPMSSRSLLRVPWLTLIPCSASMSASSFWEPISWAWISSRMRPWRATLLDPARSEALALTVAPS